DPGGARQRHGPQGRRARQGHERARELCRQGNGDAADQADDDRRQEDVSDRDPDSLGLPRDCRRRRPYGARFGEPAVAHRDRPERLYAGVQGVSGQARESITMPTGTLQIKAISAHPGPIPGRGVQREEDVCKYIDVTTCIGCKACEVACVEWNDMPFQQTSFDNTYQTMPDTAWNYWNLIKFHEHQPDNGNLMWLMRKHQCMHCEDPGCLRACP